MADSTKGQGKFSLLLKELFRDRRKFSLRLITSLLVSLAFSFTFFVFGPYELFVQSQKYLTFSFSDMALPMGLVGAGVFLVLTVILMVLRGKVHNCIISLLGAVTIAGYIQGNFLNIDHGALDGSAVEWTAYGLPMLLNVLVWGAVAAVIFTLLYFSRKTWTMFLRFTAILIIGMQIIALFSITPKIKTVSKDDVYVSDKDEFVLSEKNNVVVFLIDRYDVTLAEALMNGYPSWKTNEMKDFIHYRNFTGSYSRTAPSVCYLLTGVQCRYDIPMDDYFRKAWSESTFLPDIKKAGYGVRVYTETPYVFGDAANVKGIIDNISSSPAEIDTGLMIKGMMDLSAYRYLPECMKPYFRIYTGDLSKITEASEGGDPSHNTDDPQFWFNYGQKGLTLNENSKGEFIFYHLRGAHDPYTMDINGNKVEKSDVYVQTTGNLLKIYNYLNAMKANGTYDSSTIIITADHGLTGAVNFLDQARVLGLFIKPAGRSADELTVSNKQLCQDNLRASIVSYFGIDPSPYGRTIESIGDNEEIERIFWMQSTGSDTDDSRRDVYTNTYRITGDANDFSNWEVIFRDKIKYPFYDADPNSPK